MICAARCGPVHPASPLSVCLRCSVSQCARRCYAPHRCRGVTSPVLRKCWSVRCGADRVSARWRIVLDQPSPAARPGCRGVQAVVAHARYGHPLRFYITPHFGKCSPVAALKLRLVSPTAARPHGFPKQALCKVAFAGVVARLHRGIGQALRAVFLISGLRQSCCVSPRPPQSLAAVRHRPGAELPVRPPRGLPQPARQPASR